MSQSSEIDSFMNEVIKNNPSEVEFHQAVREVVSSLLEFVSSHSKYKDAHILERMTEPDRIISFRCTWEDDNGKIQFNRGYRVQFNNAIGPYKGGLRFHPSVNQSILKFLGFEQVFKNSLTGLPLGGGKGGSDFDPKGKSQGEVMRFCQSFMTELSRYIGPNTDVPAGDIGVGSREIGFLFGHYMRLSNEFSGILTGKDLSYGGSLIRPEATGYGSVYFVREMLNHKGEDIAGKVATISGSGNVALHTAEKLLDLGARVVSLSDSGGTLYDPNGFSVENLSWIKELKGVRRGRLSEYAERFGCEFKNGERPWSIPCDLAFPSATQNELELSDAHNLTQNKVIAVGEGANMPSTLEAVGHFHKSNVLFAPAKACNAGGVAVSGLEMSQNSMRVSWTVEELDEKLQSIMRGIHKSCAEYGCKPDKKIDYVKGANIAGFIKVADAMIAHGH